MGIGTVLKSPIFIRFMASNSYKPQGFNVTVIGAAGGIGQPLSLLLKQNPLVKKLKLYDLAKIVVGVGVDLSHIGTYTKVETFIGDKLHDALKDADVVMISAGLPRKPGMNRDDLFSANADVAYKMGSAIADSCPCALVGIITNPVNSTVPILAEAMYKKKKLDPRKIFGVTTLDLVRAETFCAEINGTDPLNQRVPVVGGHAGTTIVPLLSQACPPLCDLSDECRDKLIARIQEAGTEVVKAKDGGGSATLSMAYAGARFTNSLLLALNGQKVLEYAYVRSSVTPSSYFSGPVVLNQNGIKEVLCLGTLDNHEVQLVAKAVPQLQKSIAAALEFAKKKDNC